jgi:hypothetical protein
MATMTPTMRRIDQQIHRDVLDELKCDARVELNEIGVAVEGGGACRAVRAGGTAVDNRVAISV